MMTPSDLHIARKLKERLSALVPLIEMRVFGSRAKGTARPDSDMDVFVELPFLDRKIKEVVRRVSWETGLEMGQVISVLMFSKDEIENSPMRSSPIVMNIMADGVAV